MKSAQSTTVTEHSLGMQHQRKSAIQGDSLQWMAFIAIDGRYRNVPPPRLGFSSLHKQTIAQSWLFTLISTLHYFTFYTHIGRLHNYFTFDANIS